MADVINFVRDQRKKLTKQQQLDRKIFRVALGACLLTFVVFIGVTAARLYLAFQVSQLTDQQNQQMTLIRQQEANERTYVIFAAKLEALSELFINRRNKQQAIEFFSTLFDDTVLVSDINYKSVSGELSFGLQTKNVFTLEKVLQLLGTDYVQSRFESLYYDDITRSNFGEYQTNITVVLKNQDDGQ